jgi:hypothetical protein
MAKAGRFSLNPGVLHGGIPRSINVNGYRELCDCIGHRLGPAVDDSAHRVRQHRGKFVGEHCKRES